MEGKQVATFLLHALTIFGTVLADSELNQCYLTSTTDGNVNSLTRCEGSTLTISCSNGRKLNIVGAIYGRLSSDCCYDTTATSNTNCLSTVSVQRVQENCNNASTCSIPASNSVFGDPCVGTSKYLTVNYTCADPSTTTSTTTTTTTTTIKPTTTTTTTRALTTIAGSTTLTLCDSEFTKISCPLFQIPYILSATYGRTSSSVCPSSILSKNMNTDCSLNVAQRLQKLIGSLHAYIIKAKDSILGDPCSDTSKYLQVTYICKAKGTLPAYPSSTGISVSRTCQNDILNIECPLSYDINIISANYGRTSNNYCTNAVASQLNDSSCVNDVTSIVEKKCQGQQDCDFTVNTARFGNPCPTTYKYLEVQYTCVLD